MPDLDFGSTDEEAILVLKGFAHRVNTDLYNHGTKGLLTMFNTFVTVHETREQKEKEVQDERHRANSAKINILIAIGTLALVVVTSVGIFVTVEVSKHSQLDPAHIFHSQTLDPVVSYWQHQSDNAGSTIAVHY